MFLDRKADRAGPLVLREQVHLHDGLSHGVYLVCVFPLGQGARFHPEARAMASLTKSKLEVRAKPRRIEIGR